MANTEVTAASCSTSHFNTLTAEFHLVTTTVSVIHKGVEVPLAFFQLRCGQRTAVKEQNNIVTLCQHSQYYRLL